MHHQFNASEDLVVDGLDLCRYGACGELARGVVIAVGSKCISSQDRKIPRPSGGMDGDIRSRK
jgi:hypothetical protein